MEMSGFPGSFESFLNIHRVGSDFGIVGFLNFR
jgi:hypothetical protein